jgi:large subunit ribosomal protein L4
MATLEIKDLKGKTVGKHEVSKTIAEAAPLMSVLHRAVVAEQANSRQGTQSAKTRSEVRGGGRKPYKQKKTGNARQGSIRSPHYAHGGMALAVKPRDYEKGLNKKERRIALTGALNAKITAGDVIVADKILFTAPKTKDAAAMLAAFGLENTRRVLVILTQVDLVTYKCFRNLPNVEVRTAPSNTEGVKTNTFSTRDLLVAHKILIAADALKSIEEVWSK